MAAKGQGAKIQKQLKPQYLQHLPNFGVVPIRFTNSCQNRFDGTVLLALRLANYPGGKEGESKQNKTSHYADFPTGSDESE